MDKSLDITDRSRVEITGVLLNREKNFRDPGKVSVDQMVWVAENVNKYFIAISGLRQGCVISAWLFKNYMEGV